MINVTIPLIKYHAKAPAQKRRNIIAHINENISIFSPYPFLLQI